MSIASHLSPAWKYILCKTVVLRYSRGTIMACWEKRESFEVKQTLYMITHVHSLTFSPLHRVKAYSLCEIWRRSQKNSCGHRQQVQLHQERRRQRVQEPATLDDHEQPTSYRGTGKNSKLGLGEVLAHWWIDYGCRFKSGCTCCSFFLSLSLSLNCKVPEDHTVAHRWALWQWIW